MYVSNDLIDLSNGHPLTLQTWVNPIGLVPIFDSRFVVSIGGAGDRNALQLQLTLATSEYPSSLYWLFANYSQYDEGMPESRVLVYDNNDLHGAWHHLVGTYSNGVFKFYFDGNLVKTANIDLNITKSKIYVGSNLQGYFGYVGLMEDLAVWDRELSALEVNNLFNKGASKIGVQYKTCAQSNCQDSDWSTINYDANSNILINASNKRYFQYLIKPNYYIFSDYNRANLSRSLCTGTPISDCNSKLTEISCTNYSDQCYWPGGTCEGTIAPNCSTLHTASDCQEYALNGNYGVSCTWNEVGPCESTGYCEEQLDEESCSVSGCNWNGEEGYCENMCDSSITAYDCYYLSGGGCSWNYSNDYCNVSSGNDCFESGAGSTACLALEPFGCDWNEMNHPGCIGNVSCAPRLNEPLCEFINGCNWILDDMKIFTHRPRAFSNFTDLNLVYTN